MSKIETSGDGLSVTRAAGFAALLALFSVLSGCTSAVEEDGSAELDQELCKPVKLEASPPGPVNGSVLLSATDIACATGEAPEYLFRAQLADTTAWQTVQSWSASATATWNATGLPSGKYNVEVLARAQGHHVSAESSKRLTLLVGDVCNSVALTTDVEPPQSVGTKVELNANAACTAGSAEYSFQVASAAGVVSLLRNWGPSPATTWDTTALAAGEYTLAVSARHTGNAAYDSTRSFKFRIGETCELPKLWVVPATVAPGEPVRLMALTQNPQCTGTAHPQYRFSYRAQDADDFQVIQDFSGTDVVDFSSLGLAEGTYQVRIETRPDDGTITPNGHRYKTFTVSNCSLLPLELSSNPVPAGSPLTVTSSATCRNGAAAEYRLSYRTSDGTTTTLLRDFAAEPTFIWDTTTVEQNDYQIFVEMREAGGAEVLGSTHASVTVGGSCNVRVYLWSGMSGQSPKLATFSAGVVHPCIGGSPEYRFSYSRDNIPIWIPLRDWSSVSTGSFPLPEMPSGTVVDLRMDIRAIGSHATSQAYATNWGLY
jgi:hypothetical protein